MTAAGPDPGFRATSLHATLSGLCPLVPLPFVDDWALDAIRRRMVRDVLRAHGLEPSRAELDVLSGSREARRGCLWTLVRGLVLRLPKRTSAACWCSWPSRTARTGPRRPFTRVTC